MATNGNNTFLERTRQELSRAERYCLFLSLLLVDVSEFVRVLEKRVGADDPAIESLAKHVEAGLRSSIRTSDVVAAYDKNRVGLLLMETSKAGLETIRKRVETFIRDYLRGSFRMPFEPPVVIRGASFPEEPEQFSELSRQISSGQATN